MGLCVSLKKNSDSKESASKLGLSFRYQAEQLPIPPSPVKEKQFSGVYPVQSPSTQSNFGSKDETFFDTRVWLDSDCEDDFYSVNGDFTPSRGSTPARTSFSRGSTPNHKAFTDRLTSSPTAEPTPTVPKKKLLELFKESVREKPDTGEGKLTIQDIVPKSGNGDEADGEKSFRGSPCCIPSCRGYRKKKVNHAVSVK